MSTIQIIAIVGLCALLFYFIRRISKTRRDLDNHNPNAEYEQEGGLFNDSLDDSYKLSNILKLTWEYFDTHAVDGEFTELHYSSAQQDYIDCQIIRQEGASGNPEIKLLFSVDKLVDLPPYFAGQMSNPLCVVLQDPAEREKASRIIKETLKAKDDTKIPYQLAGSNGPECFFYKEYLDKPDPGLDVPDDKVERSLGHVLELTWAFFAETQDSLEYTEVETENCFIQITSDGAETEPRYTLIIERRPGANPPEAINLEYGNSVSFEGSDAPQKAEAFIYNTLGLTPETRVKYQLAGSEGPDDFFAIVDKRIR